MHCVSSDATIMRNPPTLSRLEPQAIIYLSLILIVVDQGIVREEGLEGVYKNLKYGLKKIVHPIIAFLYFYAKLIVIIIIALLQEEY
jgi:hypothetical protein